MKTIRILSIMLVLAVAAQTTTKAFSKLTNEYSKVLNFDEDKKKADDKKKSNASDTKCQSKPDIKQDCTSKNTETKDGCCTKTSETKEDCGSKSSETKDCSSKSSEGNQANKTTPDKCCKGDK